jgi:hypothetical protein
MDRAASEVIRQAIGQILTNTEECRVIAGTARQLQRDGRIGLFKSRHPQENAYTHGGKGGDIDVDVEDIDTEEQKVNELARVVAHETYHHLYGAPNEDPAYEAAQRCTGPRPASR